MYVDSAPMKVSIGGQPPQTVIRRIHSIFVDSQKNVEDLQKLIAEGCDIIATFKLERTTVFMLQQLVPTKVQVS